MVTSECFSYNIDLPENLYISSILVLIKFDVYSNKPY